MSRSLHSIERTVSECQNVVEKEGGPNEKGFQIYRPSQSKKTEVVFKLKETLEISSWEKD